MRLELLNELEQQHREVDRLLKMLRRADTADAQHAVLDRLVCAMTKHMEIEESEVYPELAHIGGVLVEEAQIEHDWTRNQLRQLSHLIGQPTFGRTRSGRCRLGQPITSTTKRTTCSRSSVKP